MSPIAFVVHQEPDEVAAAQVWATAVVASVVGAVAVFFGGLLVVASVGGLRPDASAPEGRRPAPAVLSNVEQTPLRDSRTGLDQKESQRRELEGWGWMDRSAGIARIPIRRAIDVVVEQEAR